MCSQHGHLAMQQKDTEAYSCHRGRYLCTDTNDLHRRSVRFMLLDVFVSMLGPCVVIATCTMKVKLTG